MTLVQRVAALETSLSPTQLVLRWLDEAHAFGDLESYARAQLLESDASEPPLDRLYREAHSGTRASLRGKRPEVVDAAIRRAAPIASSFAPAAWIAPSVRARISLSVIASPSW